MAISTNQSANRSIFPHSSPSPSLRLGTDLLPRALSPALPHAAQEPGGPRLLGEAGFASGGGGVLGVALLVVKICKFLGGGAGRLW